MKVNSKLWFWVVPLLLLVVWFVLALTNQLMAKQVTQANQNIVKAKQVEDKSTRGVKQTLSDKQPNIAATTKKLNELYTLDWTIANQKEFDDKAQAMTPLVTDEVVKKSLDFKPDTDRMMTQTGVIMVFDHLSFMPIQASNELVTGKVVVFVKSHFEGKSEATTRFVYNISYQPQSDKISVLDRIGTFQLQSDSSVL
ncbi:hypothetical protein LNP18_06070 [Leuconostoc citreum]|uniref:hypothetical protein n=1 Tax=Leuconostoc citreum TaxID=33964 RepID=UPI00200A4B48|nr:hypothetical protein [Leuconostoc citreum]MCK8605668.1 hypothetical protein [Leuconostoc citreum]